MNFATMQPKDTKWIYHQSMCNWIEGMNSISLSYYLPSEGITIPLPGWCTPLPGYQYIVNLDLVFSNICSAASAALPSALFTSKFTFWYRAVPRIASAMKSSKPMASAASACAPYTSLCEATGAFQYTLQSKDKYWVNPWDAKCCLLRTLFTDMAPVNHSLGFQMLNTTCRRTPFFWGRCESKFLFHF